MDQHMMEKLIKELFALKRQYGKIDDMQRITITKQKDSNVMASIKRLSFKHDSTFNIDDRAVIDQVNSLVETEGVVWIVPDNSAFTYDLYIPPSSVL